MEVKEVKGVKEVKDVTFAARGIQFAGHSSLTSVAKGHITSLTSLTSKQAELAKVKLTN